MSNDFCGALFKDRCTLMLYADKFHIELIQTTSRHLYTLIDYPKSLDHKVKILNKLVNMRTYV